MNKDEIARLSELTDKFALGYFPVYDRLASQIGPGGKVLEVGVYGGGSLAMWQSLIPECVVAGVDNDENAKWPAGTHKILASQTSPEMVEGARQVSPDGYDLIVDDASHIGIFSAKTFRLLWPLVRPGRWYVLEDWTVGFVEPYVTRFGASMLRVAESFLTMLKHEDDPERQIDHIEYYYGQVVIQKAHG